MIIWTVLEKVVEDYTGSVIWEKYYHYTTEELAKQHFNLLPICDSQGNIQDNYIYSTEVRESIPQQELEYLEKNKKAEQLDTSVENITRCIRCGELHDYSHPHECESLYY